MCATSLPVLVLFGIMFLLCAVIVSAVWRSETSGQPSVSQGSSHPEGRLRGLGTTSVPPWVVVHSSTAMSAPAARTRSS